MTDIDVNETASSELWQVKATTWELLALSFRYPDEVLAGAVASGEWADAAGEVAGALGLSLPESFEADARAAVGEELEALLHALRAEATHLFVGAPDPVCSPYEGVWRAADDGVQALLFVNPHSMDVERFMKSCGLGRPEGTNEPLDHVSTECELLEHLALRVVEGAVADDSCSSGAADAGTAGGEVSSDCPSAETCEVAAGAVAEAAEGDAGDVSMSAEGGTDCGQPHFPAPADLPGGSPEAAYAEFLREHPLTWMPRFAASVAEESRHSFYRAAAALLAAMLG